MLILGDIHGNFEKARAFLKFKPEEEHCFVGDYVDSFEESDEDILRTLKLCIESDAILLLGNHDLHYFKEPPFMCSGRRGWMAKGLEDIFEAFVAEGRFKPAIYIDGFLVTHGGISEGLGNSLQTKCRTKLIEKINSEWKSYLETRFLRKPNMPRVQSKIFNIGVARGGRDSFSGIFWADYRSDKLFGVPQVFGHSKTPLGAVMNLSKDPFKTSLNMGGKHDFWAIGCDNDRRICFNSTTREADTFE